MTETASPKTAELQQSDRCWQICVPYYREILASTGFTPDILDSATWTREQPDDRLPFPPIGGYQCPHGGTWHMVAPKHLVQAFKADHPMTWEMLPQFEDDFVCRVPRHPRDEAGCTTSLKALQVAASTPEVAVQSMLDHILEAHGAEWWKGLAHLCSIYPDVENYAGGLQRRREASPVTPSTAEGTDGK